MGIKRLTKEDIRNASGILNPVGHVVLAFKDDTLTAAAAAALRSDGFSDEDILVYLGPKQLCVCARGCARPVKRLALDTKLR